MRRPARPATIRFHFDADVLGLAKAVAALRPDSTYPGDPGGIVHKRERAPCPVASPATLDRDWIPEVARRGWLIIARDRHIKDHRAEIEAVREHGAKMVTLASDDAQGTWNQLEVLLGQWRAIAERVVDEPGAFIYRASRTALARSAARQAALAGGKRAAATSDPKLATRSSSGWCS